jgi:prevent-host-death family protein
MQVSVTDAKAQLTELVRRAEAGEEVILTRHGHPAVRFTPSANAVVPARDAGGWDDFFAAPGINLGPRDQPKTQLRETF